MTHLVQPFYRQLVELRERWWNGSFGRLVRRDIWLYADGRTWQVRARKGDGDAPVWQRDFTSEAEARACIDGMKKRSGGDWRDTAARES